MIRLATIGTSSICEKFLAACALTGKFSLQAVFSRDRERGERFAKKHGAQDVYTDLEQMTQSGIDGVYIASPNALHEEQSRLFLQHGKHVLCEKPIVTTAAGYDRLKTLADSRGVVYMEAMMSRNTAHRQAVLDALKQVGTISLVRIDYCQRSSRLDAFQRGEHINVFDMSLAAGALMDLGVYCVYGALDLLGMPESVTAQASFLPGGADGAGIAALRYPRFPAVITYSKTGQSAVGSEIIGDRGTLKIASISQYAGVTLVRDGKETPIVGFPARSEVMSGEAGRFADFILDPELNRQEYSDISRLAAQVADCMEQIRSSAGISFPPRKA